MIDAVNVMKNIHFQMNDVNESIYISIRYFVWNVMIDEMSVYYTAILFEPTVIQNLQPLKNQRRRENQPAFKNIWSMM
jgi:hypothetical protein